jgi:hypothetical protein
MILTALLAGLVSSFSLLLAMGVVYYVVKRKIERDLRAFITSPGENTPSPFAAIVQSVAGVFATSFTASIKGAFMGMSSVDAKNARRETAAAMTSSSPWLGAILSALPKPVVNRIMKNPELVSMAMGMLKKNQDTNNGPEPAIQAGMFKLE